MPNPNYDYLQQHPLIEIINIHWGEESVSLNWVWELTPNGVILGGSCGPPTLERPPAGVATGYITGLTPTAPVHVPAENWNESAQPGNPNPVGLGGGLWEMAWIAEDGSSTIDPVSKIGENAGSIDFPIHGFELNGEIGCYFRPDENPDFGILGVGKLSSGFPVPNTGQIVSLSWPRITITNTETGQVWTKSHYHVNGTFQQISLTITFFDFEQGEG